MLHRKNRIFGPVLWLALIIHDPKLAETDLATFLINVINCFDDIQMINSRINPDLVHNRDPSFLDSIIQGPYLW